MTVWPHAIGFGAAFACALLAPASLLLYIHRSDQLIGTSKETKTRVLPLLFVVLALVFFFGGMALDLVVGKIHI